MHALICYTERGGRILLIAERQGGEVIVAVRDTGLGIPANDLPRIFDMFSSARMLAVGEDGCTEGFREVEAV